MATVTFNQTHYPHDANDSVLDTLLKHQVDVPYGCRSGICQACMMQCTQGSPSSNAQLGLSPYQKEQGFFLSCCCRPENDITLRLPPKAIRYQSEIVHSAQLNEQVLLLRLKSPIPFQPGQTIQVAIDNLQRRFSIASLPPHQNYIELHIECRPTGAFSNAAKQLSIGDSVSISSAYGNFLYRDIDPKQPLLMVAVSTGLAPIYGIAQKALQQGHSGNIDIIHICPPQHRYYHAEMRSLSQQHPNLQLHRLEQSETCSTELDALIRANWYPLQGHQLFFAGNDQLIQPLLKVAFLLGANRNKMHVEGFKATR